MHQFRFISIFLFCISFTAGAREVLRITSIEDSNEVISGCIGVLVDTSASLDIDQVSSEKYEKSFVPFADFKGTVSNDYTYWLRISVENLLGESLPIGLSFPRQNHIVEIYLLRDGSYRTLKTGFFVSGKENDELIPFSNTIQLPESGFTEVFCKIRNINDELPDFQFVITDLHKEIRRNNRRVIFDAFNLGMMCLMILYGLFLFIHNKERLYILYAVYIIFLGIWYVTCWEFGYQLMVQLPRGIYPYSDVPGLIAFIFYIEFLRYFIDSKRTLPGWDKGLRIAQIALIIIIILYPVFMLISNLITVGYLILSLFAMLLYILAILLIIRLLISGLPFSKILALGTFLLIAGSIIFAVFNIVFNNYSFISQKLGTLLELIVFTYGISLRYRVLEREKREYQAQLIGQLEENALLQEKVNRELETKVRERTEEILQQKEEIETQRDLLSVQKNEITDSINYAQRIQAAVLPHKDYLKEVMPEYFVLYKPRDIISGDFYWIREVNSYLVVVAADCTGHGVPGAFMSMLGITLLNEQIGKSRFDNPGEILNQLRNKVKETLAQEGREMEQKDGMDMALAIIDKDNLEMKFAGAFNPLYLVRKKENLETGDLGDLLTIDNELFRLFELKGDRQPISIHSIEKEFTSKEIQLQEGDAIYLFSDGFADQIGGPNGKKYLSRNFKKTLLEIQSFKMDEQHQKLNDILEKWRSGYEQVDDILVMGIRI